MDGLDGFSNGWTGWIVDSWIILPALVIALYKHQPLEDLWICKVVKWLGCPVITVIYTLIAWIPTDPFERVLQALQDNTLFVKKKCSFGQPSLEYLGHIISANGVAADPKKVEAMMLWPVPKDVKKTASFPRTRAIINIPLKIMVRCPNC